MAKAAASAEPSMEEILASIRRIVSDEPEAKSEAAEPKPTHKPSPKAVAKPVEEPMDNSAQMSQDDLDKLFSGGADDEPEPEPVVEAVVPVEEPEAEASGSDDEILDLGMVATVDPEPMQLVEGVKPDEADIDFVDHAAEEDETDMAAAMAAMQPPKPAPAAEPRVRRPPPVMDDVAPEDDVEPEPEEPLVSAATGASVNAAFGQLSHTILAANAKTLDDLVKEMLRPMLRGWLDENLPAIVERLVRAEIERVSRGR